MGNKGNFEVESKKSVVDDELLMEFYKRTSKQPTILFFIKLKNFHRKSYSVYTKIMN